MENRAQEVLTLIRDVPALNALLIEELRRLHERVLARYGLRLPEFARWKKAQEDFP